jgi:hypothetical protein
MLFSWLTEKGILAMNPAREVKTEKFSRTEGKTPAFDTAQVQTSWIKLTRVTNSAGFLAFILNFLTITWGPSVAILLAAQVLRPSVSG